MSVNIYPATAKGLLIEHVADWSHESTVNLTNHRFWSLMDHLGLKLEDCPASLPIDTFETALTTAATTYYHDDLERLVAIGRAQNATLIAFA